MFVGKVIGNIWATRKEVGLTGLTFLVVQPGIEASEDNHREPVIAIDRLGAGKNDLVMVTEGSTASNISEDKQVPIDARIVGIIDSIDIKDNNS